MKFRFFKFISDASAYRSANAVQCDYLGNQISDTPVWISAMTGTTSVQWPHGAKPGYIALCLASTLHEQFSGVYATAAFWQGECIDNSCDEVDSDILIDPSIPLLDGNFRINGQVNEELTEATITWTDLNEPPEVDGLPEGLQVDSQPESLVISGTPETDGVFLATIIGITSENSCNFAKTITFVIEPCNVAESEFILEDPPEANESEPWTYEIQFVDIEDIEVIGLPDEVVATIDYEEGTILLESEELPATSSHHVVVSGTTTENGCPIDVEFLLNILPCDSSGSRIDDVTNPIFTIDETRSFQVTGQGIANLTAVDLPDWMSLEVSIDEDGFVFAWIGGAPSIEDCQDFFQIEGLTRKYLDIELRAETITNECLIRKKIRFQIIGCCPLPTDYQTLGASFSWNPFLPNQPSSWTEYSGISQLIDHSNVTNISVSGAPPNSIIYIDDPLSGWPNSIIVSNGGSNTPGSYLVTVRGQVASGAYEGCIVEFPYTLVVLEES
jgi:hypothetical protein